MASLPTRPRLLPVFLVPLALLTLLGASPAAAALRVVATFPDVADMTRQIGGERVSVETLAGSDQDPHRVPMKPSFVTKLNRADALVVIGLGLEHGFLPGLLEAAANPKIAPGSPAYIDASLYVPVLEVPTSQNRSQGELHPLGNPHFNLDPVRGKDMARAIAEGLARVDPAGAPQYEEGLRQYEALLDRRIAEWAAMAAPLKGLKLISYHPDLVYLAQRYGLDVVDTIELRPGVPATPGHVEELVARMKAENVHVVAREVTYDPGLASSIAERTGATVVSYSVLTGGLPGTKSYVDFVDANLRALVAVAGSH
ncbi:MAG TPA: metal ABC transporter substrate-binding protein [Myxococcota bacterium]|nr:metal ABC transporter substrate-binding protein [Myxococcota bacterium]